MAISFGGGYHFSNRISIDISRLLSKTPCLSRKNANEVQVLNSLQGSLEVQVFPWVEEQFF